MNNGRFNFRRLGELLRMLDAGQLDVVVGMAYSEERVQKYKFNRESLLGGHYLPPSQRRYFSPLN